MAESKYEITLSDEQFSRAIDNVVSRMREVGSTAQAEGSKMDASFQKVGSAIGAYFAVDKLREFANEIVNVRKEMQGYQISLSTLLGSDTAGTAMFNELKDFAVKTPLMLNSLAGGAQTMLGFNIEAQKVVPLLKSIGDISMGDAQRFQSLTLAFSQMSATGKLMGQDLLQMINAGFNPLMEISKKTGKSISDLKDEMSAGAISAEMVTEAFQSATSEGGQFYGMLEKQGKGLAGQLNTLKGAIDDAYNSLGEATEGIIASSVGVATELVKNYEQVGRILAGLVTTYGAYRTAVMLATAAEQGHSIATLTARTAINAMNAAQKLLNATMLANPYVAAAAAVGLLVTAFLSQKTMTEQVAAAEDEYNRRKEEAIRLEEEHKAKIEQLLSVAGDESLATETRRLALVKLEQQYPSIFAAYDTEAEKLEHILDIKNAINVADGKASVQNKANEKIDVDKRIKELEQRGAARYVQGTQVGGRTEKQEAELRMLKKKSQSLGSEISKDNANAYMADLTGVSNERLRQEIKAREVLLAKMKVSGKSKGVVSGGGASGEYSKKELEGQIGIFEGVLAERNKKEQTDGDKQWWEKKKKDAEDRLSKLTSIEAAGKKGAAIKKEIEQYDEKLASYKTGKKGDSKNSADAAEKAGKELARQERDMELERQQARISIMQDGQDKTVKQIELNYAKEREAIKREQEDLQEKRVKAGGSDALTDNDRAYFAAKEEAAKASYEKQLAEQGVLEAQSLRDYLSQYGTFQQQKLAIAEEYADKIAKAQTEGERLSLEKERDGRIAGVNATAARANVDWGAIFGGFDGMIKEQLKRSLDELNAYIGSGEFKKLDATDQQTILSARSELQDKVGASLQEVDLKKIGQLTQAYQLSVQELINAQEDEKEAYANLAKAQKAYDRETDDAKKKQKKLSLDAAQESATQSSQKVQDAQKTLTQTQTELNDETNKAVKAMNGLSSGLGQMGTSLSGTLEGLKKLAASLGGKLAKTVESIFGGATGSIITAALEILDILKDGVGSFVSELIDMVFDVVNGVLKDVLSGDIITKPLLSIKEGLQDAIDNITFGGLSSWTSGNASEVAKTVSRLEESNKYLRTSIEELADQMGSTKGAKMSIDTYKQLISSQKEFNKNLLEQARAESQYHNAHHSWAKDVKLTEQQIKEVNKAIADTGESIGSTGGLFEISPEAWKKIRSLPDVMKTLNSDEYSWRVMQYVDQYIEQAGKLGDYQKQLQQSLMSITFDSVYDEFVSLVSSMDNTSKDFADNFSQMMYKAMLNNKMGDAYRKEVEAWYDDVFKAMQAQDGQLTDAQIKNAQAKYQQIAQEAQKDAEALQKLTGANRQELTASTKSVASMSEETGSYIAGRLAAIQMSNAEIAANMMQGINAITAVGSAVNASNGLLADINISIMASNSYLANIYNETYRGFNNVYGRIGELISTINAKL